MGSTDSCKIPKFKNLVLLFIVALFWLIVFQICLSSCFVVSVGTEQSRQTQAPQNSIQHFHGGAL